MKNNNLPNIILIISILIFTGISVLMVVRNIPFGIVAVLIVVVCTVLSVTSLIVAAIQKSKIWAIVCRVIVALWLLYLAVVSFVSPSENEDALLWMTIYVVAGILAMVLGMIRNKK